MNLQPGDLQIVHVMNCKSEKRDERIDFFIMPSRHWVGEVVNNQPDKCDQFCGRGLIFAAQPHSVCQAGH